MRFAALHRSLRNRVTALAIATTFAALLMSGAALFYYDARDYRQTRLTDLRNKAEIIGRAAAAAMLFNDLKDAQEMLDTVKAVPTIDAAALYRSDGSLFAAYHEPGFAVPPRAGNAGPRIEAGRILYLHPIVDRGETVGTVYLDAHDGLAERMRHFLGILGAVMAAALGAAFLLSSWLQRKVTQPILEVADAARSVERGDFSVRARKTTQDEIGALADAFNRMLDEIDRRARELGESEERFRTIANSAPVLMWMNDDSGAVFVNKAYLDFLGVSGQVDVQRYDWAQYVHPDDRAAYVEAYLRAVNANEVFDKEFRFRRHDGEYRWMRSVGAPRLTAQGERLGYTGCTFDIHDAREAADALRLADRRKDEFLATLAHELRNPLAPLLSSVSILQRTASSDPQLVWARDIIERQVRHMARLLDDLMDVSRITSNKLQLRRQRVGFAAIVESAVETSRPLIEGARHRFTLEMPRQEVFVDGDPVRLAQVFSNLLNNAARYTDPGGELAMRAAYARGRLSVAVSDNGIGIAAQDLPRLFQIFSQSAPALQRGQGGLGIGLFLVKHLVELHGGSINVQSAGLRRGTTFVVDLPASMGREPEAPRAGMSGQHDSRTMRIVVADDNRDAAESLAAVLRAAGHEVRVAHDGQEALEIAAAFRPAVALLDIGMPRMNGYEAAQRIRREPWGKGMLLIAITGWGQQDDRRRAFEAGFDNHLTKPAQIEDLEMLIGRRGSENAPLSG